MKIKKARTRRAKTRLDSSDFITTDEGWKHSYDSNVRTTRREISSVETPLSKRAIAFTSNNGYISSTDTLSMYKFKGNYYCCFDYDDRFSENNDYVTGSRSDGDR